MHCRIYIQNDLVALFFRLLYFFPSIHIIHISSSSRTTDNQQARVIMERRPSSSAHTVDLASPGIRRRRSFTSATSDPSDHLAASIEEGPLTKARKVSRACDFCKSRKAKCSGHQPCAKCVAKGRACDRNWFLRLRSASPRIAYLLNKSREMDINPAHRLRPRIGYRMPGPNIEKALFQPNLRSKPEESENTFMRLLLY